MICKKCGAEVTAVFTPITLCECGKQVKGILCAVCKGAERPFEIEFYDQKDYTVFCCPNCGEHIRLDGKEDAEK